MGKVVLWYNDMVVYSCTYSIVEVVVVIHGVMLVIAIVITIAMAVATSSSFSNSLVVLNNN